MTYEQTLSYLYAQMPEYQRVGASAYKEGLDNSLALDAYFQHPHKEYKIIHVGGTNGKGSTSHLLAAVLQSAGYKVGLYTSPHLVDFRERIRVNGKMVSKDFVVDFVEKHRAAFEPIMPSFFELTMEMAFVYFAAQKVDVAIVEVGLGGRLDSTNIVSSDLSVITNIGFDHMKFLGDTLPKIAREKAGIIKSHTPVVIGETEDDDVRRVFEQKAQEMNAPIRFAQEEMRDLQLTKIPEGWQITGRGYNGLINSLGGFAQEKNSRTVLCAIEEWGKLGHPVSSEAVAEGFKKVVALTGLMGRWQTLQNRPLIVADTGHNAHGMRYIVEQLAKTPRKTLRMIFGMVNDKDITAVLQMLPKDAVYYFTKASIERAMDEKELQAMAQPFQLHGNTYPSVNRAIEAAKKDADENDLIFIGGSSFVVADALPMFEVLPD